jgi:D-methionine transport system substrate-binding protein
VDVAIISTTYIQQTGLSPVHDSVFIEDKNSPYVNIVVTREDNKDAENVKEFIQSYQSPEVAKAAETIFNGGRCRAGKRSDGKRVLKLARFHR